MKLKLKSLLLAAVAATTFSSLADSNMPGFWQDTKEPWTAKYFYAPLNTTVPDDNWYAPEFDDSSWDSLECPIYRNGVDAGTIWSEQYSAYWIRSHFTISDTDDLLEATIKLIHDDACMVYINGRLVYEEEIYSSEPIEYDLSPSLLNNGDNVLAVYVADTGGGDAFLDLGIIPFLKDRNILADVNIPGTLGDIILAKVDDFSDVSALKISGKLDSNDMETISKRLINLRYLDMENADLKEIANSTFYNNSKLTRVILPENLEIIGRSAFYGCKALTEVIFPEGLRSIDDFAFYNSGLNALVFPEGLNSIGEGAFHNCRQLTSISFPSSLKQIKSDSFSGNTVLSEVNFSEGLESIGSSAFSNKNEIRELKFPSSLRTISTHAFYENRKLRDIKFNEGLTTIGDNAFYHCDSLREVTLPSTLVRADASPFDYCDNLRKVTCLSVEPPYMTDQIPYGCSMEGRELYVPNIALNIYKQTAGWDKFPTIEPIDALPQEIIISRDERLTLLQNLPAGYKPDLTLKDVYIDNKWSYGRLEMNGDTNISLGKLSLVMDPNESSSYHPFTAFINNVHMQADSIEVKLYATPNKWTFISFPFDVRVGDIIDFKDGTTSFVIRRYVGENRAAGESGTWQDMKDDDVLKAGEGYIFQGVRYIGNSRQSNVGLAFPSIDSENLNNVFITSDAKAVLTDYPSEQEHNRGWNLIGNPYPCYYDSRFLSLESPVTVWDGNTYKAYSPLDDSYVFTPGESFFVQCPAGHPEIVFDVEGRQKTRAVREIQAPARMAAFDRLRKVFDLTLSGLSGDDATRIVLNDAAAMSYESSRDAAKFFSHEESVGQLYTVAGEVEYAINERPVGGGEVALGVRIGTPGTYTISLPGDAGDFQVWLDDAVAGSSVRLDGSEGYSFYAESGKIDSRFMIRFVGSGVNSVEGMAPEADAAGSGVYTIDGRSVARPESGSIYIRDGKKKVKK